MKIEDQVVIRDNAKLLFESGHKNGSTWLWAKNLGWDGKAHVGWQVVFWEDYKMAMPQFRAKEQEYPAWTFNELFERTPKMIVLNENGKRDLYRLRIGFDGELWRGYYENIKDEAFRFCESSSETPQDLLAAILITMHEKHVRGRDNNQRTITATLDSENIITALKVAAEILHQEILIIEESKSICRLKDLDIGICYDFPNREKSISIDMLIDDPIEFEKSTTQKNDS